MNAHDAICKAAHDALCKLRIPHAEHVWSSPVPFFDYVADAIEAAVSAAGYSITLTDDGAPPADSTGVGAPAAAESATTTAAPSSPHQKRLDRSIAIGRALGEVIVRLEANDETLLDWWPCDDCPNHPGPCACSGSAMARTELSNAILPLFGEGATSATKHRPTCGTAYGESCDGYCPTPAIDRATIMLALYEDGAYCGDCDYETAHVTADGFTVECNDCDRVLNMYADTMLALIEGAQ